MVKPKLHLVCVATIQKGYFSVLLESCKRNNLTLHVLGFNQKWQGFLWKIKLIQDFLSTIPPLDIVMVIDAYDVILLQDYNVVLDRFASFKTNILLSRDGKVYGLHKLLYSKVFPKCGKYYINAGSYMGYAFALKDMFKRLCISHDCKDYQLDDQVMISTIYKDTDFFNKNIKIDVDSFIFCNIMTRHLFTTNVNVKILGGHVVNQQNIEPCVVHAPGNGDLNPISKLYNYPLVHIEKDNFISGVILRLPLYIKFFYSEIICVVLLISIFKVIYSNGQ